jgi:hypothetical protein
MAQQFLMAPGQQILFADSVAEIAEGFAGLAAAFEILERGDERGDNLVSWHKVLIDEVEPVAEDAAA